MRCRFCMAHSARFVAWLAALLLSILPGPPASAQAQSVADFYKDKTIRLLISSTVGGGYDIYGRLVAKHLPRHLPGHPTIVPQNMAGGGGIAAANNLNSIAPKDGTVIAIVQNNTVFEPFFENKAAMFDATKFGWLGTPLTEVSNYLVWRTSKINSLRDAQTMDYVMGTPGSVSTPAFYGRLFNQLFKLKARLVTGYPGQNEVFLAMEQGEVDGVPSSFWSSLKPIRPTWFSEGHVRSLFQFGDRPHPELKGVPFALDLVENPTDKAVLTTAIAPFALGRPLAAPPDIPADRLAALRAALMATFKDPQFLADCDRQKLECTDVRTGPELETIIRQAYTAPDTVRQRLIAIQNQGRAENKK